MTDVVAALIWDGCRFLACQRPAHKKRALLWEFVGGKREPGEALEECLIRECQEELDIIVQPKHIFMQVVHSYPDITVRLTLFNAVIVEGEPKLLEHNAMRWMQTDEIDPGVFCPADKDILAELKNIHNFLQAELYAQRDINYQKFMLSLIPGYSPERFMGVRMPALRKIARSVSFEDFDLNLPHAYYEEDCLHALLINDRSSFEDAVHLLDAFLPFVDNWAVCDLLSPKAFRDTPEALLSQVDKWLVSEHPYTVRFAIGVLRKFYLGRSFDETQMQKVADISSDHYYVKMMIAWYFATALDKQFSAALEYLNTGRLDSWVHNKSIQKACESLCISDEKKTLLRSLKTKRM